MEFLVTPLDPKNKKLVRNPLEGFPERPNRTTRIQVSVGFLDEHTMAVGIRDRGFGDLFPATDSVIRKEVMILVYYCADRKMQSALTIWKSWGYTYILPRSFVI